MKTTCIPGAFIARYSRGMLDHRGQARDQEPVELGGALQMATDALLRRAPPYLTEQARNQRLVRFLWRYLAHLTLCFSEAQDVVEEVAPRVIAAKQDLFLAGLQRDCLPFAWTMHPQNIGAHLHGGLVLTLLPFGGPYRLNLPAWLSLLHDRLVSYKLGLSDPLARYPLVM